MKNKVKTKIPLVHLLALYVVVSLGFTCLMSLQLKAEKVDFALKARSVSSKEEPVEPPHLIESHHKEHELDFYERNLEPHSIDRNDMERIQVTGSRIKHIEVQGSYPVLIIDKDEIEKTGYNSVSDILRDITVNSFGSGRESSGKAAPGTSEVNLRGLGADRTLVLLDGKRIQKDPFRNAVDLNLIPLAAIKRIDVLKDGASSIYGSEALGGVVNIITRKTFMVVSFLPDNL